MSSDILPPLSRQDVILLLHTSQNVFPVLALLLSSPVSALNPGIPDHCGQSKYSAVLCWHHTWSLPSLATGHTIRSASVRENVWSVGIMWLQMFKLYPH